MRHNVYVNRNKRAKGKEQLRTPTLGYVFANVAHVRLSCNLKPNIWRFTIFITVLGWLRGRLSQKVSTRP